MTPEEMNALEGRPKDIAKRHNVKMHHETELLVTDLFPAEISNGLHVLIFYKGSTLDKYLALKKTKVQADSVRNILRCCM